MNRLDPDVVLAIVLGVLIGVHLITGIISSRIAAAKGRDPLLGFAIGLLLNVFGLIIAMMMRPSIEAEAQRRIEVEREYERQRRPGPYLAEYVTNTEPTRRATISIRRVRGEVVDLPVVVLSTPYQRTRGFSILVSGAAARGVLYFWPQGGTHSVKFVNPYVRQEIRIIAVNTEETIEELLTLTPGGDSTVEPTKPVASAIAFRAERFEGLGIDIGDKVVLPDELRT